MAMEESREFYTLIDEDTGKEVEFELIGSVKIKDVEYFAMIPADAAEKAQQDGGFCEYVILKKEGDDLVTVDDDDEFDDIADVFDDMFSEEIDYDGSEKK